MAQSLRMILLAFVTLFGGCVWTQQAKDVKEAGFLGDYSMLHKGEKGQALLVYRNPETDFSIYKKVTVDPVTIWKGKDSELEGVSDADLHRLANELQTMIIWHINQDYVVVPESGPGVMRIQVAITEARESNVGMDVVSTVLPPATLLAEAESLATGTQAFVGEASIEVKVTDEETGELLLAAVDRRAGGRTLDGVMDSWDDVEHAFDYWANRTKERLRELRGIPAEG